MSALVSLCQRHPAVNPVAEWGCPYCMSEARSLLRELRADLAAGYTPDPERLIDRIDALLGERPLPDCAGCTEPQSEGTHALGTRQHPDLTAELRR